MAILVSATPFGFTSVQTFCPLRGFTFLSFMFDNIYNRHVPWIYFTPIMHVEKTINYIFFVVVLTIHSTATGAFFLFLKHLLEMVKIS